MTPSIPSLARLLAAGTILSIGMLAGGSSALAKGEDSSQVAARVDGKTILRSQLTNPEIAKAREELYTLELATLRFKSLALLRESRPKDFPPPEVSVSDEEVAQVYQSAGLSKQGTLESMAGRIREYVISRKSSEIDQLQYQLAVSRGLIEENLPRPPLFLYEIADEKRPASKGKDGAPIRIVEFSDFQCPFCNRARPTVDQVMAAYKGKVHLTYRHMPLTQIHSKARGLAEASECAAEQGRFWPYHDHIFDHLDNPGDPVQIAETVKMPNMERFQACLETRRYSQRVEEDIQVSEELGIRGTPTFFVGKQAANGRLKGVLLRGAVPLEQFEAAIERMLIEDVN